MAGKRGRKEGHHGGGWKVAYADFVTSMMALFLVLWLVGSDTETKLAVQRYFRGEITQQGRNGTQEYAKPEPFENQIHDKVSKDLIKEEEMKRELEKLREQLNNSSQEGDDLIRYEFIADGVRITVIDSSAKPFFEPGTAKLTFYGEWVLKTTAWYLDRFPFTIEVEGHTQKGAEVTANGQAEGWDLSTSRAVAARDLLQNSGLPPDRFWRIIGYSDRIPLEGMKPEAEVNRRITIVARLRPDMTQTLSKDDTP
ncbi:MAG: flagellar motor protein MotB [Verrucomicrobiota bacterium]